MGLYMMSLVSSQCQEISGCVAHLAEEVVKGQFPLAVEG